jgi:hypothetical protein
VSFLADALVVEFAWWLPQPPHNNNEISDKLSKYLFFIVLPLSEFNHDPCKFFQKK